MIELWFFLIGLVKLAGVALIVVFLFFGIKAFRKYLSNQNTDGPNGKKDL